MRKTQDTWYDAIINIILSALKYIASTTLCVLIIITCIDVIGRYFLNSPLMGSTELTEISLGILIFTSMPLVSYYKKHIVVDLLDNLMPKGLKKFMDILSYALIAFGMYQISIYSEKLIKRSFNRELVTEYLEIPAAYIIIYSQFMGFVTCGLMLVLIIKTLFTKQETIHAY